ncbi:ABC transporter permease [Lachnotalea sp. AF33-28]|uniref:ABC transporter permease n=1 Tax=Lachnotalea sp. AF33-28 TaxID=2292046 RepID=UPI000E519040|nr:ABC transporter permease subunit [Lachnotalea sp. AF33-28]RHP33971.1 sugar ABC transporter permease [Lachnotalea sp. AF33-28]
MKSGGSFGQRLLRDMRKNWILYVMILPVVIYYLIFAYTPMYGVLLAFKDFNAKLGIMGSPWVGLEHFKRFFSAYNFKQLLLNTLGISVYSTLVGFPIPILFALMLNYLKNRHLKKTVQMVSYAPYFISTVVICGMITIFLKPDTGVFNIIRGVFGMESTDLLARPEWFKTIYVWSGVWQGMGWSSIIYISALLGVDPQLHEAAIVDGATKVQRIIHVDLPSIKPTIIMLMILQLGSLMNVGFEKVFLLQNALNRSSASVISTYTYEVGLINSDYGYSTAVGLFSSLINIILIVGANEICKKFADESLF